MGKSNKAFQKWRKRMGLTYPAAAQALGLARNTVVNYDLGIRCDVDGPVQVPKVALLACSALESRLPPIE